MSIAFGIIYVWAQLLTLLVCWVTLGACGNLSEPQSPPSIRRDTLVTGLKGLKHLIWVHRLELRAQKGKKKRHPNSSCSQQHRPCRVEGDTLIRGFKGACPKGTSGTELGGWHRYAEVPSQPDMLDVFLLEDPEAHASVADMGGEFQGYAGFLSGISGSCSA